MSQQIYNNIGAVVLGAGKGTRLGCVDIPKVMLEIGGRPIISYIVETLKKINLEKEHVVLVVGFKKEKVKEYFKDSVTFAEQLKQEGTAHAAFTGMKELPPEIEHVLVLGGDDSAFYRPETLETFINSHIESEAKLSLLTAEMPDPSGYGRIIRHPNDDIEIIEKEYLTEEQNKINEISTGTFCFNRAWFESIFPNMPPLRKLGEYGLPTALAMARKQKEKHQVVSLKNYKEFFGVNTPEQLEEARRRKATQG